MGYSRMLRLWHWTNAVLLSGIFLTVFLRKTFFHKSNIAHTLTVKLSDLGLSISHEHLMALSRALRNPMWSWHIYMGIGILVLLSLRVVCVLRKEDRPILRNSVLKNNSNSIKDKFKYSLYAIFYTSLIVSLLTGVCLHYGKKVGIPKEIVSLSKDIHEILIWILLPFLLIHLIGTLFAELKESPGIVSRMIHGNGEDMKNNKGEGHNISQHEDAVMVPTMPERTLDMETV